MALTRITASLFALPGRHGLRSSLIVALLAGTQVVAADGYANFASYTSDETAVRAASEIESRLSTTVVSLEVEVGGTRYIRLRSAPLSDWDARGLVKRAKTAGYDAWFESVPGNTTSEPSAQMGADDVATVAEQQPTEPVNPRPTLAGGVIAPPTLLTNSNPELANALPEGPLLGEIYPPRKPMGSN